MLDTVDLPPPYHSSPAHKNDPELKSSSKQDKAEHYNASSDPKLTLEIMPPVNRHHNERKIWLCPHLGIDFDQAKQLFTVIPTTEPFTVKQRLSVCPREDCKKYLYQWWRTSSDSHAMLSNSLSTTIWFFAIPESPHPHAAYQRHFTFGRVATALHGLDFPICAHIRINQSFILSRYNPACQFIYKGGGIQDPCPCSHMTYRGPSSQLNQNHHREPCSHVGSCHTCREQGLSTSFLIFVAVDDLNDGDKSARLAIHVSRDLGTLESPDHASWLVNTVEPYQLAEMASKWPDWLDHIRILRGKWFKPLFEQNASTNSSSAKPSNHQVLRRTEKVSKPPKPPAEEKEPSPKRKSRLDFLYRLRDVINHRLLYQQ